jgi:hypothetical protein
MLSLARCSGARTDVDLCILVVAVDYILLGTKRLGRRWGKWVKNYKHLPKVCVLQDVMSLALGQSDNLGFVTFSPWVCLEVEMKERNSRRCRDLSAATMRMGSLNVWSQGLWTPQLLWQWAKAFHPMTPSFKKYLCCWKTSNNKITDKNSKSEKTKLVSNLCGKTF